MELIRVVDKNGNYTGEIIDRDEAHERNLLHNEIGVFVINDKGEVLLQRRSPNKKNNPNKWGLCSGHVGADESLIEAALREIKEEIGLDISKDELYSLGERKFYIGETNSHITYFFYIKSNLMENEFVIQKDELSEVKWFDIDEVINRILDHDDTITSKEDRIDLFKQLKDL